LLMLPESQESNLALSLREAMLNRSSRRDALTLMELVVVMGVLVALAAVLVPFVTTAPDDARQTTTKATLKALRDAVLSYYQDMKGVAVAKQSGDVGPAEMTNDTGIPYSLRNLQLPPVGTDGKLIGYDPVTRRGWRGPYVMQSTGKFDPTVLGTTFFPYGALGDPAFVDGWANPIVLQWPSTSDSFVLRAQYVRLVSAGPVQVGATGSVLETVAGTLMPTPSQRGNDLLIFIRAQDQFP
jgi:type II secretory pathway pseudopilin PulG